jgi:hypothetical protein
LQIKNSKDYFSDTEFQFSYESSQVASLILDKIFSNKDYKALYEVIETTSGFGGKSSEITNQRISKNKLRWLG